MATATEKACANARTRLFCLDAQRGGYQYRRYCARCWECIDGPLPHDQVAREAVAAGRRARLHTDGSVLWSEVITTDELERRRALSRSRA